MCKRNTPLRNPNDRTPCVRCRGAIYRAHHHATPIITDAPTTVGMGLYHIHTVNQGHCTGALHCAGALRCAGGRDKSRPYGSHHFAFTHLIAFPWFDTRMGKRTKTSRKGGFFILCQQLFAK